MSGPCQSVAKKPKLIRDIPESPQLLCCHFPWRPAKAQMFDFTVKLRMAEDSIQLALGSSIPRLYST